MDLANITSKVIFNQLPIRSSPDFYRLAWITDHLRLH